MWHNNAWQGHRQARPTLSMVLDLKVLDQASTFGPKVSARHVSIGQCAPCVIDVFLWAQSEGPRPQKEAVLANIFWPTPYLYPSKLSILFKKDQKSNLVQTVWSILKERNNESNEHSGLVFDWFWKKDIMKIMTSGLSNLVFVKCETEKQWKQ